MIAPYKACIITSYLNSLSEDTPTRCSRPSVTGADPLRDTVTQHACFTNLG